MAMSGSQKNKEVSGATNKAVNAAKPINYSDPNGSVKNGVFTPNQSATQIATQGALDTGINNSVNNITSMPTDVNSVYNNPFYQSTVDMYSQPVNRQYEQDNLALQNNLNAKGLTGGSYDAYKNSLLQQNRDYNLNQAQQQARGASANAYQQAYTNQLGTLQGLNAARTSGLQNEYMPLNAATAYQGAVAPLQNAQASAYANQANYYANQPTFYDNYMKMMQAGAQTAASAAAAM